MNFFTGNNPAAQSRSQIRDYMNEVLDYQKRYMARLEAEENQRQTLKIAACASLLDEVKPGWAACVNLEKLDIRSPSKCIMGQVFAPRGLRWTGMGWTRGQRKLGDTLNSSERHGWGSPFLSRRYEPFWREEIIRRTA